MNASDSKKIAIIGSGFVGKATGKGLIHKEHQVVFYDINPDVIRSLNTGGYTARHIDALTASKKEPIDIFMVSVPTPTIKNHIRLNFLKSALRDVGRAIDESRNFPLVVIRSTVPPGTVENFVVPILEKFSGKKAGVGFGVCMNPEFLREVSAEQDFSNPWIIVIGSDDRLSGLLLGKVYRDFNCPVIHMSLKEAEMTKYVHNLLNATKISFFNEMRFVGSQIGVDNDLVFKTTVKSAEAMWNPEYGTRNLGPFDGSCLPKDTRAFFTWTLENFGFEMPVLKGTILENEHAKKIAKTPLSAEQAEQARHSGSYEILPKFEIAPLVSHPKKFIYRNSMISRRPHGIRS